MKLLIITIKLIADH